MVPEAVNIMGVVLNSDTDTSVMVNLGCGGRFTTGWQNFDLVPLAEEVEVCNLLEPLPFATGSVDVIYHSHVLEHLRPNDGEHLIEECYRSLKIGGILRVVVPDLEQITRTYLACVDEVEAGVDGASERHEWMIHELVDQMVRDRPGGRVADFWLRDPLPAADFVRERVGTDVDEFRVSQEGNIGKEEAVSAAPSVEQEVAYRRQGEVHRWMYDRFSLAVLLRRAGFSTSRVCAAGESEIQNWARFCLDTHPDGMAIKPDSFYIEAVK